MMRLSILVATLLATAAIVAVGAALSPGTPTGISSAEAHHGIPRLPYVSMRKSPNKPKKRRFTLRLFTADTHAGQGFQVEARRGSASAFARFKGANQNPRFHEWWIRRTGPRGKRVIRKLVRTLRKRGRVTFPTYLYTPGAIGPQMTRCTLRGFNRLGACRGRIIIH